MSAYSTAPDAFLPIYPNGNFGFSSDLGVTNSNNSVRDFAVSGVEHRTTTQLTTTFELDQDLSMLVKGLSFTGKLAFDNTFLEARRGINDLNNTPQLESINPVTGQITLSQSFDDNTRFDYHAGSWVTNGGTVQNGSTYRKIYYQLQLNYDFTVARKNNFTEMALFNRTQNAIGNIIPHRRENFVFRTTYNYNQTYIIQYNGSYNGSEKFSSAFRFGFFSSGGVAWNISNENFMENIPFIDHLKLRASYGKIGDDNAVGRWLYLTQWAFGGQTQLGTQGWHEPKSPYKWYYVTFVGNNNVHWATVTKKDIGLDFGFFDDQISGSVDYFNQKRSDIIIEGSQRSVPSFFGEKAPAANLGRVRNKGYEVQLNLNHSFGKNLRFWATIAATHAKNKVIFADDPALLPRYQKEVGKAIGQNYSFVGKGYYNTWGELYASTPFNTNDNQKLPGGRYIVDYNADGIINDDDNIPYGFSSIPENTYSTSVGFSWRGLSGYVQFYGVTDVTRNFPLTDFPMQTDLAFYEKGGYWSLNNLDAPTQLPRWLSTPNGATSGDRFAWDGSYLRLKNAQISYDFGPSSGVAKGLGIRDLQVYVNGENLILWTKMPDDRESNYAGGEFASQGAYPTVKRVNFGVRIKF